jgi:hypothetical protein
MGKASDRFMKINFVACFRLRTREGDLQCQTKSKPSQIAFFSF